MKNFETNRRDMVKMAGVGAGALLGLKFADDIFAAEPIPLRVRRNIAELDADGPEVAAYKAGVKAMKMRANDDNTGWQQQAVIHQNHCPHGNWYFLPWHRAYLDYFEQICREASGYNDFNLPYWNWTTSRRLPEAFWGADNPLMNDTRRITRASQASLGQVGQSVIDGILAITDFQTFASLQQQNPNMQRQFAGYGQLEGTPHNYIHGFVGGEMATFMSPLDACFWCHHANVDRLWAEWNELGNGDAFNQAALDHNFANNFYDTNGDPIPTVLLESQLTTYDLGYRYDTQSPIAPQIAAVTESVPSPPIVAEAAAAVVVTAEESATIPIRLPGVLRQRLTKVANTSAFDIQAFGEKPPTVRLQLEGITPPEDQNVVVRVFLDAPNVTAQTSVRDPHYVGSFCFFEHGGHGDQAGHGGTRSFSLELTSTLQHLQSVGQFSAKASLNVQVVTLPIHGDTTEAKINVAKARITYI